MAKTKRSTYGFTERQLWERAGVSRSTIQRFKRGDHLSDEMLKRVEKARRSLLKQEARALLKEAKSRLQDLRDFQFEAGYKTMGPAGEYFVNKVGLDVLKATGKTDEELMKGIAQTREFLNKDTSTVGGVINWLNKVEQAARETSGLGEDASEAQLDEYWSAFNEIKNNQPGTTSQYFGRGKKFDSNQLRSDLRDIVYEADGSFLSKDELIKIISESKTEEYKRQQGGKDDLTF